MTMGESMNADSRLDFVTALPVDDCLRLLKRGARRTAERRLLVQLKGDALSVEWAALRVRRGQAPLLWLLRFEGDLTPVSTGTRVRGSVVHNTRLESLLIVPGLITVLCCGLGIALEVQFVSILSVILLILFATYYGLYRHLLSRQAHDLLRWVYEWLTVPQGRAGGSL
jgi:hypothetical protein